MIDCHLHLQDLRIQDDLEEIMDTARKEGVSCMHVNGTHPGDWSRVEALTFRFPGVMPSFGLHPWKVNGIAEGWEAELEAYLLRHPIAGVGEIGLDKWIRGGDLDLQREVFTRQLEIARRLQRPVSIHCLQAWGSLRTCLDQSDLTSGWLLHSYGGPLEMVDDLVERGAFFSLSGYFFRPDKREKLLLFERIPDDRILLETDAPDMMPPPDLVRHPLLHGGSGEALNHPGNLSSIYKAFSLWRGIPPDAVIKRMRENFKSWFFQGERKKLAATAAESGNPEWATMRKEPTP